ncbi:MAG: zinc-binding dehydrogenase [Solirubrobacteraceae bacterium]
MIDCVPLDATALGAVVDGGRVVTLRPGPDPPRGIDRRFHLIRSDREVLRQVVNATAAGQLRTCIARVLPLNSAAEAHRIVEAGGLKAKWFCGLATPISSRSRDLNGANWGSPCPSEASRRSKPTAVPARLER